MWKEMDERTRVYCTCGVASLTLVLLSVIAVGVWRMPVRMEDERERRS